MQIAHNERLPNAASVAQLAISTGRQGGGRPAPGHGTAVGGKRQEQSVVDSPRRARRECGRVRAAGRLLGHCRSASEFHAGRVQRRQHARQRKHPSRSWRNDAGRRVQPARAAPARDGRLYSRTALQIGMAGLFFRTALQMSPTLDPGQFRAIRQKADDLGMCIETGLGKVNPYANAETPELRAVGDGDIVLGCRRIIEACAAIDCRELWTVTASSNETTSFELVRLVEGVGPDVTGVVFEPRERLAARRTSSVGCPRVGAIRSPEPRRRRTHRSRRRGPDIPDATVRFWCRAFQRAAPDYCLGEYNAQSDYRKRRVHGRPSATTQQDAHRYRQPGLSARHPDPEGCRKKRLSGHGCRRRTVDCQRRGTQFRGIRRQPFGYAETVKYIQDRAARLRTVCLAPPVPTEAPIPSLASPTPGTRVCRVSAYTAQPSTFRCCRTPAHQMTPRGETGPPAWDSPGGTV